MKLYFSGVVSSTRQRKEWKNGRKEEQYDESRFRRSAGSRGSESVLKRYGECLRGKCRGSEGAVYGRQCLQRQERMLVCQKWMQWTERLQGQGLDVDDRKA